MGAWTCAWRAVVCAAILGAATRAAASTQVEPIARLFLEGGYDSNALYLGDSDQTGRISPDVGVRLRDHNWTLFGQYGGDYIVYRHLDPNGTWNHRASIGLHAAPSTRLQIDGTFFGGYVFDQVGLAQIGIFRTDETRAGLVYGRGHAEWRATPQIDLGATLNERTFLFQDGTGGAMHQPIVEGLWRFTERFSLGAAYAFGVFQSFDPGLTTNAYANALRARARWIFDRETHVELAAGPALWSGPGPNGRAIVPEGGIEVLRTIPGDYDLRVTLRHALGIGTTARPALINAMEFGAVKHFGREWELRADGGIWDSGVAPTGENSWVGYSVTAEAALLLGRVTRIGLVATNYGRLDQPSSSDRRTTVGLRVGWELETR